MNTFFVHEFFASAPTAEMSSAPLAEGLAMLRAVASDLARLPGAEVTVTLDRGLGDLSFPNCRIVTTDGPLTRSAFQQLASQSEGTLVIAPEWQGILLERTLWAEQTGSCLLSVGSKLVRLASDKWRTGRHLARHSIPVPEQRLLPPADELGRPPLTLPLVVKPCDGAGSDGLRLVCTHAQWREIRRELDPNRQWLVQRYCPGHPVSVAVIAGPDVAQVLIPCQQQLSDDGRLGYLGGGAPLPETLARRATTWASAVVACLPGASGYLGIDLVLGADPSGRDDYVIEINPRITTSYVGLQVLARTSLAAAVVAAVQGVAFESVFDTRPVQFNAQGAVRCIGWHSTSVEPT